MVEEVLAALEQTQHEFWNISRVTGKFLNLLVREIKAKNVLEVGTSNGYSGIWLGLALKQTGGKLTTIEYWDTRLAKAKENFKKCALEDVIETVQGSALEVLEALNEDYDLVFIDANKSEYVKYFEFIDKHLKVGGIIVCDNVLSHEEKCRPFIDAINAHPAYHNVILPLPAGLSMGVKILNEES